MRPREDYSCQVRLECEESLEVALIDLVIANRVLARLGAVDAYGHVSLRHPTEPNRFLLSCSRSPRLVDRARHHAIRSRGSRGRHGQTAFVFGTLYPCRPLCGEGGCSCRGARSSSSLLPFTVTDVPIRPLFMTADEFGANVPLWDIRTAFGSGTNLLITNLDQGRDLAKAFGRNDRVVLLAGSWICRRRAIGQSTDPHVQSPTG